LTNVTIRSVTIQPIKSGKYVSGNDLDGESLLGGRIIEPEDDDKSHRSGGRGSRRWPSGRNTTALKSNDALWRNGSCSAIVLTATTGNCRARWAVEATGNEYHPWPLRCQPFYRAARPRTGEGGLNGAPIPDEKSCRLEGSSKKNRQ
jgi:hypothetical protein